MSRQLEYYYRNKEKINKKFAEKYRNNIEFREEWKEKRKKEQKEYRNSTKILTKLEEWCKDGIKDELFKIDYGTKIIGTPLKIHLTSYEMVLDKIQELKEDLK